MKRRRKELIAACVHEADDPKRRFIVAYNKMEGENSAYWGLGSGLPTVGCIGLHPKCNKSVVPAEQALREEAAATGPAAAAT